MWSHKEESMEKDKKHNILIVDDLNENIEVLFAVLKNDYILTPAKNGKSAIKKAKKLKPDLILLDIMMPEMDGYEVCRQLKSDEGTSRIPIIFVTAKGEEADETKGLNLGAVDYIAKPIRPPVVKARIATHLKLLEAMQELKRLYDMALDSNPMTGLPGNISVAKKIKEAIEQEAPMCVIYSDLDNFKAFNDKYGFALGDEALLFTSNVLQDALKTVNIPDAFIGHIGGDDFVMIVPSHKVQDIAQEIVYQFDKGILQFYSPEDIASKCIHSVNRKDEKQVFPLMTISLAGVDLSYSGYQLYVEVNDACAEAKKQAKQMDGSSFFLDRRKRENSSDFSSSHIAGVCG